jgi:hypothetical protein
MVAKYPQHAVTKAGLAAAEHPEGRGFTAQ